MPSSPFLRLVAAGVFFVSTAFAQLTAAPADPAPTDSVSAALPDSGDTALSWDDCGGGFQCGSVGVPLDYSRPHGQRIEIALTRKPALDPQNRIGSLFLHPGGAGMGATFLRLYPSAFFEAFARFDVIGFDVRGLGRSRPAIVACGRNPGNDKPYPRPRSTDHRAFATAAKDYVDLCYARNRELLAHLSTANMTRDLERLRIALGEHALNYLGTSFGSVVGANYATLFPGRARAILLDSPLDVQGYYERPLQNFWDRLQGHEDALARFLAACRDAGSRCDFGGGDPQAAFQRLIEQLDREPMPSPDPADPRRLSGDDLREAVTAVIADSRFWAEFAAGLKQVEDGDPRALLAYLGDPDDPATQAANTFYEAITTVDQRWPRAPLRLYFDVAALAYERLPHLFFAIGYPDVARALWPVRDQAAFRGRIRNPAYAEPILVVSSTRDAAAPYAQGRALVRDLGNARLLTRDADGHGAIMNPCVLDAAVRYFNFGELPPRGKVCPQDDEPFPPPAFAANADRHALPLLAPHRLR